MLCIFKGRLLPKSITVVGVGMVKHDSESRLDDTLTILHLKNA
jgi:hypothetical protein